MVNYVTQKKAVNSRRRLGEVLFDLCLGKDKTVNEVGDK